MRKNVNFIAMVIALAVSLNTVITGSTISALSDGAQALPIQYGF